MYWDAVVLIFIMTQNLKTVIVTGVFGGPGAFMAQLVWPTSV